MVSSTARPRPPRPPKASSSRGERSVLHEGFEVVRAGTATIVDSSSRAWIWASRSPPPRAGRAHADPDDDGGAVVRPVAGRAISIGTTLMLDGRCAVRSVFATVVMMVLVNDTGCAPRPPVVSARAPRPGSADERVSARRSEAGASGLSPSAFHGWLGPWIRGKEMSCLGREGPRPIRNVAGRQRLLPRLLIGIRDLGVAV